MGVSVLINDADFNNVVTSLQIADRTDLVGEWFFGDDEATTIKNRAGDSDLVVQGTPVYGDGYVECTGGGYGDNRFDTQLYPPQYGDVTVIAVCSTASTVCYAHGYTGLYDSLQFFNGQSGAASSVADLPAPTNEWNMVAGAGELAELGEVHSWADGERSTAYAEIEGGSSRTQNVYKIFQGSITGAKIAYLAIFERKLEADELDEVYTGLKQVLAQRGINIG